MSSGNQRGYTPSYASGSQRGYYTSVPAQAAAKKSKPVYRRVWFWIVLVLALAWIGGRRVVSREKESASRPAAAPRTASVDSVQDTASEAAPDGVYGYYGSLLSASEKKLYARLLDEIGQFHETITFTNTDKDELKTAYRAMYYDHPELFWITDGFSWESHSQAGVTTFEWTPKLFMSVGEAREVSPAIHAVVEDIAAQTAGMTDYETALFVHDYIISHTTRDNEESYPGEDTMYKTSRFGYGCLMEHLAFCGGYSAAYQWVLQECGIECILVAGSSRRTGGLHGWNCALLDGEWYYIDLTWDDFFADDVECIAYDNFCITTEELLETHIIGLDDDILPDPPYCSAEDCNYLLRNGFYIDPYDESAIRDAILRQVGNDCIFLKFASAEDCQRARTSLVTDGGVDGGIWAITGLSGTVNSGTSENGRILRMRFM